MKKKILVDAKVIVDPPSYVYYSYPGVTMEQIERRVVEWVREFNDFLRDHRSQDQNVLSVERVYKVICSFCEEEWEADENGVPVCCEEAIKEHNLKVKLINTGERD